MSETTWKDYSLLGTTAEQAVEKGLAEADWYTTPIPREEMRKLLVRKNGPAIRDTILWFGILIASGYCGYLLWGSWWAIIPFAIYGVIYGSSSDSRWHEASHGTAFKSDWMNNALYEIASFMVVRESTPWRWSHARHHSDTIIVGRDPEISVPRPPDIFGIFLAFFTLKSTPIEIKKMFIHASGKMAGQEATYIPKDEQRKVFFKARIYLAIYMGAIGLALYTQSFLPLMYILLPNFYGAWLMPFYGLTQHAGLEEDILDHRLNCRTVKMNFINRFLYWNMNYHVEHHMFPLVPYHALPKLHELMKHDTPAPYTSIYDAFREIIPTVLKQRKDPTYYALRELPEGAGQMSDRDEAKAIITSGRQNVDGWQELCPADQLQIEDVLRYDHLGHTYAIYRADDGSYSATDGMCTHGNTHLANGLVKGKLIECPKHNGRFDIKDGSVQRSPVCIGLKTYPVRVEDGILFINTNSAGGAGIADEQKAAHSFRVISNHNVATFIKELILEPLDKDSKLEFTPGDYLQFDIPPYEMGFEDIHVDTPYRAIWEQHNLFDYRARNHENARRNYSLATNPASETQLRFNVRIATPPAGKAVSAGIGSSYVFNLKPGDEISAIGPFGDFRIKETDKEMVYLGGGAGMAPLRSHLSYLFETLNTKRKVSFWYGARSLQEIFYQEYFEALAARFENFEFHIALSEPLPVDDWNGRTGFIHKVLQDEYLSQHSQPTELEYYLCGPPMMLQAARKMLTEEYQVTENSIAYDEF